MKSRFLKTVKRILITALVLLLVLISANEIVYRNSIPDHFANANWSGKWHSSEYYLVSGKVLTTIPADNYADFKSETLIYYNLWSLYKPGQKQILKLSGNFSEADINGNNSDQKSPLNTRNEAHLSSFKAKMSIGKGQYLEYDGMKEYDGVKICGKYDSSFPLDEGTFELSLH